MNFRKMNSLLSKHIISNNDLTYIKKSLTKELQLAHHSRE